MMRSKILVTGATGNTGREVIDALLKRGFEVRGGGTKPEAIRERWKGKVEAVFLDFLQPSSFAEAVGGCGGIFLLRPPAIAKVQQTLHPLVEAGLKEGVERVVFLSVAGAEDKTWIPHRKVEDFLKTREVGWTLLRPGFFAQNLQDAYRDDIREEGRLYVPAGRGLVTFVDLRDVAEVAAKAFEDPAAHQGKAYTLTGPEAVSFSEVAAILSEVLGRSVRYEEASVLGYLRHLGKRGLPWGQRIVQTILHVGLRFGQAARVDPTLEALLGRRGRTIREYVVDASAAWKA